MDLKEISSGVDPSHHWYYQSKKIPLLRFLHDVAPAAGHGKLIDIGAGNGFFAGEVYRHFSQRISEVLLVDTAYTEEQLAAPLPIPFLRSRQLPAQFDHVVALLMDVLEHVENDWQFLEELRVRSSPGGSNAFFITVPAFNSLWSGHDVYLGHYRRYTRQTLQRLLVDSGYRVKRIYYIYNGLLPLAFLRRRAGTWFSRELPAQSELRPLPALLNKALLAYTSLEMRCLGYFPWFGLTCVAEGSF